jgi:hypothetical protein
MLQGDKLRGSFLLTFHFVFNCSEPEVRVAFEKFGECKLVDFNAVERSVLVVYTDPLHAENAVKNLNATAVNNCNLEVVPLQRKESYVGNG